MKLELLSDMSCPYCGAAFRIRRAVSGDEERLAYGLIECRCFAFPVVDGVLLLSLAKGYGGAEETLQPYVPLQVAAVHYLERDDVAGLRAWIRRHVPFAGELIDGSDEPYLSFAARVAREVGRAAGEFLDEQSKYEVLGNPRQPGRATTRIRAALRRWSKSTTDDAELPTALDYYAARYFSPRVNALALQLGALPPTPRILSLCCGQGVFENLLRTARSRADVVSLDGQFLNLLITRRFADHGGSYICHDVQFPLPFHAGTFDGVFSSTCLPEIPTQRTFAGEAIRVTSERGWTNFDSIWNTEMGVPRIDPGRHYRFCQNFFSALDDYVAMFKACAGEGRRVGVDVPGTPAAYLKDPGWAFGADVRPALAGRDDYEISVLVLGAEFPGFVEPDHGWLRADDLAASHAFRSSREDDLIALRRRPEFETLPPIFAPKAFAGYPKATAIDLKRVGDADYLLELFTAAHISVVPPAFTREASRLLTTGDAQRIGSGRGALETSD